MSIDERGGEHPYRMDSAYVRDGEKLEICGLAHKQS